MHADSLLGNLNEICRFWKDNIKMGLKETGWESVEWIHLDQDRKKWWALVNTVKKLRAL